MSNIDNQSPGSCGAAAPHEVEAHRNAIGDMLQSLSDKGIDVAKLAQQAGVSSADIDQLSHDDLGSLTVFIARNHPEVLQAVAARYPAAQGLIGMFASNSGFANVVAGFFQGKQNA
jgi:hypothetical protein